MALLGNVSVVLIANVKPVFFLSLFIGCPHLIPLGDVESIDPTLFFTLFWFGRGEISEF